MPNPIEVRKTLGEREDFTACLRAPEPCTRSGGIRAAKFLGGWEAARPGVHREGIGNQRRSVRAILARLPEVISFDDAGPHYGGSGATIVNLRPSDPQGTVPRVMSAQTVQNDLFEVRSSTIHGTGVFARVAIPAETEVLEYVGERLTKEESMSRRQADNFFIFTVTDAFDIDGSVEWNPARFINHSCAPNCEAREGDERIWIFALRDLQAGEELTFNYGYELEDYEEHPCRCGASECLGYMVAEEYFEEVRRKEARKRGT